LATNDSVVLLERAREYDAQALAEIYDRYAESIYRYVYRFVGDASLAEDLTSEVFLKLLQVLGTSRAPQEQLQGWLYRVARNLAVDWYRQQTKGVQFSLNEELTPGGDSAITRLEQLELHQDLIEAIHKLTPSQQQVIILRFGEGRKIGEVARLMGKSEGSVKLMQYRAVKRLRKLLENLEKRRKSQVRGRTRRNVAARASRGQEHLRGEQAT
jgi:RNA polymerase sigma-70 factor (ECF subfamily)